MSEMTLQERSRVRQRSAIELAALRLFSARGYDSTTVAQIADSAEVSPRTASLYFSSKLHLALSYATAAAQRLATRPEARDFGRTTLDIILEWVPNEYLEHGEVLELHRAMLRTNPMLRSAETPELALVKNAVTVALAEDLGQPPDGVVELLGGALEAIVAVLGILHVDEDGVSMLDAATQLLEAVMTTAQLQFKGPECRKTSTRSRATAGVGRP